MANAKTIRSEGKTDLTTKRIEALTDGIFAIAMTLLVLTLELPEVGGGMTQTGLHRLLLSQSYMFVNYVKSFLLLAIFWIVHHQQFHYIRRTDRNHLWINIFTLMVVAMIPFSASVSGDFANDPVAEIFFGGSMFILGALVYLNWLYATSGRRLVDRNLDSRVIRAGKRRGLVVPIISLIAMITALVSASNSSYCYLLIPIVLQLPYFRR